MRKKREISEIRKVLLNNFQEKAYHFYGTAKEHEEEIQRITSFRNHVMSVESQLDDDALIVLMNSYPRSK